MVEVIKSDGRPFSPEAMRAVAAYNVAGDVMIEASERWCREIGAIEQSLVAAHKKNDRATLARACADAQRRVAAAEQRYRDQLSGALSALRLAADGMRTPHEKILNRLDELRLQKRRIIVDGPQGREVFTSEPVR